MHMSAQAISEDVTGPSHYDVAVLGSGLAGSILAACLARNGARVALLDAGTHPRFAIGESSTPFAAMMFRLISERYGVPEIKQLASFEGAQATISSTVGRKRNSGFVYHRPDRRQDPREATMVCDSALEPTQVHLYRQDVDAWLSMVAVKYGATLMQHQRVTGVEIDAGGVRIDRAGKDPLHAKYIIDTVGSQESVLSELLGVRQHPARFRHQSRLVYSHLLGVRPYDEIATQANYRNPSPWHDGTLHHVFPGGWLWVIPFDNHRRGPNPLTSVGLSLDPRVHPARDCSPEQEFSDFIGRFPDLKAQFASARPAREWARVDQVQHSCEQTVGYRWCLTADAAGYLDPLMTGGLSRGLETTHALVHRLLQAIADDDFATERFEYVGELEQGLLDFNDDLYAGAYSATASYPLWNAWYQLWTAGQQLAGAELTRSYARYLRTRDTAELALVERPWWRVGAQAADSPNRELVELFHDATEKIRAVELGKADPDETAQQLKSLLADSPLVPPLFGVQGLRRNRLDPAVRRVSATLKWARRTPSTHAAQLAKDSLLESGRLAFKRSENELGTTLRNLAAELPIVRRKYRVPAPK